LTELAKRAHYSLGYLSRLENGHQTASPDVAQACDQVLRVGGRLQALVPPARLEPQPKAKVAMVCPYRGLAAFEPEDAPWFFGREQATAALVARLAEWLDQDGPVMLSGASGVGKSSLLRAGLVPALARGAL